MLSAVVGTMIILSIGILMAHALDAFHWGNRANKKAARRRPVRSLM
jgi:hypothetical protein